MMKKKLIAALLAATVAAGTMPSAGALLDGFTASRTYSNQFTDVPTNAWYYNSVKSAYNLGLVNGSSATTYSPNKEVTIAELYAMASRIHATYYGNEIQPVDGAWFAPYVEYSQEYLDTGSHDNAYSYSDGVLVANLPAARWYFACILYAAVDPSEFNQLNHVLSGSIEDIDAMENEEVRDCIYTLYNAGILTGSDAYGTFHPNDGITRAEVAAIMARIIDPSQRKTFTLKDKPKFALNGYAGSYFTSLGDPNRSWMGYTLNISSINSNGIYFTFQYDKSGHAVGFTTQKATFTSATTATANGTTYYADQPAKKIAVKYYFTFSDYNINLKIYQNGSVMYNIDFDCNGTVG